MEGKYNKKIKCSTPNAAKELSELYRAGKNKPGKYYWMVKVFL